MVEGEGVKTRSDGLEQQVKDACKAMRIPDTEARQALDHMHYDDVRKVIYCYIPKVSDDGQQKAGKSSMVQWNTSFLSILGHHY